MTGQEFINTPEEKEWTGEDIRRDILLYQDRRKVARRYCITTAQVKKIEEGDVKYEYGVNKNFKNAE